jgi:hypothetical protein
MAYPVSNGSISWQARLQLPNLFLLVTDHTRAISRRVVRHVSRLPIEPLRPLAQVRLLLVFLRCLWAVEDLSRPVLVVGGLCAPA